VGGHERKTPLSDDVASWLAAQKKIGMWNGVGALLGSAAQVRAAKQTIDGRWEARSIRHVSTATKLRAPAISAR
jgi:hypothetical protein